MADNIRNKEDDERTKLSDVNKRNIIVIVIATTLGVIILALVFKYIMVRRNKAESDMYFQKFFADKGYGSNNNFTNSTNLLKPVSE